jgi:hypothetical protein
MTKEQADALVTYLEVMEGKTNHQANMREIKDDGWSEQELDAACRALGAIAGRDYGIL